MHLIVDAHEDLAWNALTFGRDVSRSVNATRELERGSLAVARNGSTLLGLDKYLAGGVAVIFSTLFAAPVRRKEGEWDVLCYADAREAHRLYAQQLDHYKRFVDEHEQFVLMRGRGDLESVLASWSAPDTAARRIGLVPLMEGADAIRKPPEAEWWRARGVRIVGLAWAGTRYAGGTREPGPLTPDGRALLNVIADLGLILDLSHAADESFLEALDRFEGTVIVSHANPRVFVRDHPYPERFLTDEMIRRVAERDGVIGIVPYNRFVKNGWPLHGPKDAVAVDDVAALIDHVCQVTGRAAHVGLGSDFDGGFGVESVPAEIDTVADLQKIGAALQARGYSEEDAAGVLGQNWITLLRRGLPA